MALILLVDDEEAIASVAAMLLETQGHRVVVAGNGAEALREATQQPPDVVVTDLMMPVMDGVALCNALERDPMLRQVPIILMSAAPVALQEAKCNACHRLRKPFDAADLFAAVRGALAVMGRAKNVC